MAKAIALSRTAFEQARIAPAEMLRAAMVLGCGSTLIFAGTAFPL